jgi:DNA-binding NarL/FixJ family response regulator
MGGITGIQREGKQVCFYTAGLSKITMSIKLLIVDDHRLFREGLNILLRDVAEIEVIGDAHNGKDALLQVRDLNPDVVLMDIEMPELNGIDAIRLITHKFPDTKILALTSHEDDEHVYSAMSAGASGYVAKRVNRDELVNIIKSTYKGEIFFSPFLANVILKKIPDRSRKADCLDGSEDLHQTSCGISLTPMEKRILHLIAEGYTNVQIAKTVYTSRDTVKVHLKSIYKKLQVKSRTGAAVEALRRGLV